MMGLVTKRSLKVRILIAFCFFLAVNFAYAQKKQLPVKVVEATKQDWVSGAPGGKYGTKYSIKVYINTETKVEFKNVWIGKENVPFDVEFFSLEIPKRIQYGDTLLLTYNKIAGDNPESADAKRLPIDYKGAALIEVSIGGKTRYFIVKTIKPLLPLKGQ